jgi:hypothetical protein
MIHSSLVEGKADSSRLKLFGMTILLILLHVGPSLLLVPILC